MERIVLLEPNTSQINQLTIMVPILTLQIRMDITKELRRYPLFMLRT